MGRKTLLLSLVLTSFSTYFLLFHLIYLWGSFIYKCKKKYNMSNEMKKYYCPHCGHYMENDQLSHCSSCGVEYKKFDTPCEQEYEIGDEVQFKHEIYRIKDVQIKIPWEGGFMYEDMYLLEGCEEAGYLNSYLLYKK